MWGGTAGWLHREPVFYLEPVSALRVLGVAFLIVFTYSPDPQKTLRVGPAGFFFEGGEGPSGTRKPEPVGYLFLPRRCFRATGTTHSLIILPRTPPLLVWVVPVAL